MNDIEKVTSDYYKKYIGQYAKRFYNPFTSNNIHKICGFYIKDGLAYFNFEENDFKWYWDVEDCVIISDEKPIKRDKRIANIHSSKYHGYNPFTKQNDEQSQKS